MRRMNKIIGVALLVLFIAAGIASCGKKNNNNPNVPQVSINLTVDPNSTLFLELNSVGGWIYLDEVPGMDIRYPSRGIIVYRQDVDLFKAYERQPPNVPFQCCDANQNCTKLIVGSNYPFVKDTCTETLYSLLDGTIFSGEGQYSLIQYNAFYDGVLLYINN
jgi:hypothetical protein